MMGDLESEEKENEGARRIAAEKCVDALRLVSIDRRIRELSAQIAVADRLKDEAQVARLSAEHSGLDRLRKSFEPQSQIAQAEKR
jgi:hypothetical protein